MNTYIVIAAVVVGLFLAFFFKEYYDAKLRERVYLREIGEGFSSFVLKDYSSDELSRIKTLCARINDPDTVDDITASDIEFDRLFCYFNHSVSSPGSEYFYYRLRTPIYDKDEVSRLERKVSLILENEELRKKLQAEFLSVGSMKGVSFWDCLDLFSDVPVKSIVTDILPIIGIFAGIGLMFVSGPLGVFVLVASLIVNILSHYKARGEIDIYVVCLGYIVNFLNIADKLAKHHQKDGFEETEDISKLLSKLFLFRKIARLAVNKNNNHTGTGNPLELLGDYLRMIFHIDIISFYRSLKTLKEHKEDIGEVYMLLGKIESYVSIAALRASLPAWCVPETAEGLKGVNLYHPLIKDPVKNSITVKDKSVLVTGSNASGKSTFLKTVLINALFAKSINTCPADEFSMEDFAIYSSMSLRDDLFNEDSYFMVEIKALKRIMDKTVETGGRKVLCFLDEVLRGTNTIERIAACVKILSTLKKAGATCFVATHDIELTKLLTEEYDNYYFDESVTDNDISFSYLLKSGFATTKNAIRLLSLMGFSEDITKAAENMALDFEKNGKWRVAD
ncbi:MAG: hypothetical protein K5796_09660 [Lachnospiraceae bacterium]|nr:hypothetical protein [Lachnospiraceae bacterium]